MAKHSISQFSISFLLSVCFAYIIIGFLNPVLDSTLAIIIATLIVMTIANVLVYLSLRDMKWRSNPLNIILALSLPVFFIVTVYICLQFHEMFLSEYISIPQQYFLTFLLTAIISGFIGYFLIQKTNIEIKNGLGIYLGGMFFFIHLILARTLNYPALSYNVVLFEADAGPWMEILASPESAPINRAVHPLSLIIIRPLMRLASFWMGEHYPLGAMLVVSATAGLCVFMAYLFIKRATESKTYAFLFAMLLGFSASHLLFGSLTENYIFGAASLIFFFLLIQSKENRFSILVPAGLVLFGITITNIAQGVIGLFFNKFNFRRLIQFFVYVLVFGILLTLFTNFLYPKSITYFFSPKDIAFEFGFVKVVGEEPESSLAEKLQVTTRTMALYGVVAPKPIEAISEKPPFPTIDLKTFDIRTQALASYKGIANIPLVLWLILLVGSFVAFIKNIRTSKHQPLMLGLLGALGFNFIMHLFYGTELFLYTPYWMYALIFFIALSLSEFAEKTWFQIALGLIVFTIAINNFNFIFSILKAIAPFYSAL
ncbi:MAG TPA: hypothetical protein PLX90_02115 [Anaerolineales bacterium]|nr:hypothetical protein [Anaerolineales bacterium]